MEAPFSHDENPQHMIPVLLAHEHARARAWIGRNRQVLDLLLAPDFVEINVLGHLSKSELLGWLFSSLTLHDFVIEQPDLRIAGPQVAILTSLCQGDPTANGQWITGTFHVAAHYVRRGQKWLFLLWQITFFAEG